MLINRKDTPAPFTQRNNPPHFPSSRIYDQQSAPHTPQNKSRSKRTSKVHRGIPRERYMDGNARGTADDNARDERISHDLNLTDATRYSVVDNMLQSLNPDQTKLYTPPKDRPPFSSGSDQTSSSRSATQPRHFHSSSNSSDYTFSLEDSSDRPSSQFGRGRRSHSSSNYQSVLGRIDSVRDKGEAADGIRARVSQVQRGGAAEGSGKGHTRHWSKGSGSSSADFGRTENQSWMPNAMARRSASFDHGYGSRALHSDFNAGSHPAMPTVIPQSNIYNIDAAPTPTVPAGPRRDISPVFPPHPGHAPPVTPGSQRRDSNKSTKSSYARRGKNETLHLEHPVPRMASRRGSKQASALPAHVSRQPSPVRQYSEPVMPTRQEPQAASKDTVKERPGFFRRVFGSSRGGTPAADLQTPPRLLPSSKGDTRANSRNGFSAPDPSQRPPPSEDSPHPPPEAVPPQLVKKPSSFFRRRKKSISEATPPPALPLHLQPAAPTSKTGTGERESVSSLRKVMTPYLDQQQPKQAPEVPKASSAAQYNSLPSRPNVLRPSRSFEPPPRSKDSGDDSPRQARDLASEVPAKTHLNPKDISSIQTKNVTRPIDTSFFNDDSSDSRTPDIGELGPFSDHESAPLQPAPTSVPADMTPKRTTSKGVADPGRRNLKSSPGGSSVLTQRDTNLPDASRSTVITPRKAETKDTPSASQATPPTNQPSSSNHTQNTDRVWLESAQPDENLPPLITSGAAKIKDSPMSPDTEYFSAPSTVHSVKAIEGIGFPKVESVEVEPKESLDLHPHEPTDADRALAKQVFEGDETITTKATAAAWLGEPGPDRTRIRKAYMNLFEWQNLNILVALRDLCGRLYLKGEAQQVDRILDTFSSRWCACNPQHGFKATDVVHTICYSVLLLNTDLHQAEIETKMTRQQFLRNILPTVRRVVRDAAPDAFTSARASTMPPPRVWAEGSSGNVKPSGLPEANGEARRSFEGQRPVYKLAQRPSDQTVYSSQPPTPLEFATVGDCGPLVKTPFHGKQSTWENQVEIVLKDFFNSIRQQPLPLYGTEGKEQIQDPPQSSNSLSAMTSNVLRRTPSMLSRAGSENQSYSRGRPADNRLTTGRWQSKTRSRPRLYPASTGASSSRRSSFDEHSSVTTPSITSAWSKFSSLGRTQTTLSIDSLATSFPQGDYQQSIGFANALSQAIIREEGAAIDDETLRAAPLLEDESLGLAGAPWAKEGILKHKHHLEAVDKRAKDRNWAESFAVIEKGYMRLFSFSMNAKSLRQKAKARTPGGVVGGGNWADNAETLGTFTLRQTIASALPPPGYSKARPHVWALSLPTGAVHLFQVGTPEIVKEFVTTANYWSARLSKEPMVGGISNIEYGWGDSIINPALLPPDVTGPPSSHGSGSHASRPSLHGSIRSTRSSMDQGSFKPKLPGDKVTISDWTPPQQSMVASALMEVDQLKALLNYVKNIEEELQRHNEFRGAVLLAFSPRHPNSAKAMTNWERKSSYLLREIVKFRTYIDCLMAAQTQKEKIYGDRARLGAEKEKEKDTEIVGRDGTASTKAGGTEGDVGA